MAIEFPLVGYSVAVPANSEELAKDTAGFTHPNLHRRIDPQTPTDPAEQNPREYTLGIYGMNSYRTTQLNYHNEESTTVEIP